MIDSQRRHFLADCAALGAGLGLAGCANGIIPATQAGDETMVVRVEFVDADLNPIDPVELRKPRAERTRFRYVKAPDPIELLFLATPGRVAGPGAELLLRQRLRAEPGALETRSQRGFPINLTAMRHGLERFAQPYLARPEDQGMRMDPGPARIARLALAPAEPGQMQPYAALTGFIDRASGLEHLLLFCDRPCRITGRIDLGRTGTFTDADPVLQRRFTGLFIHELDLPHPGLHWATVAPAGERRWLVRRADAPRAPDIYILDAAVRLT